MRVFKTEILTLEQMKSLFLLWNLEYPATVCYSDISQFENYLNGLSNTKHYFVLNEQNQILGWGFSFVREEENWFSIILDSQIQRKGYGRVLLNELKKNFTVLNGWVVDHNNYVSQNKEPYLSPIKFYTKNEFLLVSSVRIENEKISAVKIRWKKE